jgi:hypothetical protein
MTNDSNGHESNGNGSSDSNKDLLSTPTSAKLEKTKASSAAARSISMLIRTAEKDIRQKWRIFENQDAWGLAIWIGSFLMMFLVGHFYLRAVAAAGGTVSLPLALVTIVIMGFPISLLHELEHDIIHNLYFKAKPWVQDAMFYGIWIAKLHGSPWFRRELHLKHHQLSGQLDDAEERLIGLGLPMGAQRMAVTLHPLGGVLVTGDIVRHAKYLDVNRMTTKSLPVMAIWIVLTKTFLCYTIAFALLQYYPAFTSSLASYSYILSHPSLIALANASWPFIRNGCILLAFPNTIRQACLVLMSNTSHYYGDIPMNDVFYQNQILAHPLVWFFQAFCFNFGATHVLHHYVVAQPFYLRQLVYMRVAEQMVQLGVRRNDFGILSRGNNYIKPQSDTVQAKQYFIGVFWFLMCGTLGFLSMLLWDTMIAIKSSQKALRWAAIMLGLRKRSKRVIAELGLEDHPDNAAANALHKAQKTS